MHSTVPVTSARSARKVREIAGQDCTIKFIAQMRRVRALYGKSLIPRETAV